MEKRAQLEYLRKKMMGMQPDETERFEATEIQDLADFVKLKFHGRGSSPALENANEKKLNFVKIRGQSHGARSARNLSITFGKISALVGLLRAIGSQSYAKPITVEEERELGHVSDDLKKRAKAAFDDSIAEWKEEDFEKRMNEYIEAVKLLREERNDLKEHGCHKERDTFGVIVYQGCDEARKAAYNQNANKNSHFKKWATTLKHNHENYQPYTTKIYEVFHALALEKASTARARQLTPNQKNEILEYAYAYEAFGCHYLANAFTSSRMRTPKLEILKSTQFDKKGQLLCNQMHDEDNENGLRVRSKAYNSSWIAYGDKMLHHTTNSTNFKRAREAVQLGVNEVFQASEIEKPQMAINESGVFNLIPYIDPQDENNTPMFQVRAQDGKVCRRKELNDLQCKKPPIDYWTPDATLDVLNQSQRANGINHSCDKENLADRTNNQYCKVNKEKSD